MLTGKNYNSCQQTILYVILRVICNTSFAKINQYEEKVSAVVVGTKHNSCKQTILYLHGNVPR